MQELILADDLFPSLMDGSKRCTIRAGQRQIALGLLKFKARDGGFRDFFANVISVRVCRADDLTDAEAAADGAENAAAMRKALLRFYPDLKDESPITIIMF